MTANDLEKLLNEVKSGDKSIGDALDILKYFPYTDLGFARIDHHREVRTGYPEIVYCAGKTTEQVIEIFKLMSERENNIVGTRADQKMFDEVKKVIPEAVYYPVARIISIRKKEPDTPETSIAVISAGTSDMPVAEEAAVTAEAMGNKVQRIS